jgi:hypothetical protein
MLGNIDDRLAAAERRLALLPGSPALRPQPPITKAAKTQPDTGPRRRELLIKAEATTDPTLRQGYRDLARELDNPKEK